MFEVGGDYRITTGTGDEIGCSTYRVLEVDLPLVKVEGAGIVTVLNTHAPTFHSAELDDPERRDAAQAAWLDSSEDDKQV